jgi:lipoprotein-releasing system permease protein
MPRSCYTAEPRGGALANRLCVYKLLLILKYLRKRRIAWVSLAAVMLCTTMVLVVSSVMGGWLRMFRAQFRSVSGDIIVEGRMAGFPHYDEMLQEIRALPAVKAAAPVIQTYALMNLNNSWREGVQVLGYPPEIQDVNSFRASCFVLGAELRGRLVAEDPAASTPAELAEAPGLLLATEDGRRWRLTPFGLHAARAYLRSSNATADVRVEAARDGQDRLVIRDRDMIDPIRFTSATQVNFQLWPDMAYLPPPNYRGPDPRSWGAMVVGSGLVGIQKNRQGRLERPPGLYSAFVFLTMLPIAPDSSTISLTDKVVSPYWIIDDCRTGVSLLDSRNVYVAFDALQRDLQMDAHDGLPARCHAIQIALRDGADMAATRTAVEDIVRGVVARRQIGDRYPINVKTWDQQYADFIGAVEKERGLLLVLFGIISLVAIFLIFCIFYSIVVEKTRDIGIIKSVGATPAGVAAIFLGYGAGIGIVGSALGLGLAWVIVRNINAIHDLLLARDMGIWNPNVYLFDTIPNTMNPAEAAVILVVAVVAAVIGAIVPALRAANLNPVEALRWE